MSCIHAARMAANLWWQVTIVCAAVLDRSHLLLVAGGNLWPQLLHVQCSVGSPHIAVHCLVIIEFNYCTPASEAPTLGGYRDKHIY